MAIARSHAWLTQGDAFEVRVLFRSVASAEGHAVFWVDSPLASAGAGFNFHGGSSEGWGQFWGLLQFG